MNNTGNRKNACVLVVDDEPRILRFVKLSLASHGFDVITASNGEEALKLVETEKPDLMILDIFMPGMDGFAVLQKLRATEDAQGRPRLPVIVFSARNSVAEQAFSLGASDFIPKPFVPDEIAEKARSVIEARQKASA